MIRIEVGPDPGAAGRRAAELIAEAVGRAVAEGRRFSWAISGGETPIPIDRTLGEFDLSGSLIDTWQVDERIAPLDHPDRNLTRQLRAHPGGAVPGMRPMPVDDDDLEAAADRYAGGLPARFDMAQLGIGADGPRGRSCQGTRSWECAIVTLPSRL